MALRFHQFLRFLVRGLVATGMVAALTQCARETLVAHRYEQPRLGPKTYVSADRDSFGYRKWTSPEPKPETIVIGIHGFCGAAIDYENLGEHITTDYPDNWVYAYEVRGQGNDPQRKRRGDIDDPDDWFHDLYTFTDLVRKEHPKARVVWFGESMGGLIATHAYRQASAKGSPPCDALVLSSPVVKVRSDFPEWKKIAVRLVAYGLPKARVSVEALAAGQPMQMTHDTIHAEQSETNSWHVERHTLRLLVTLGDLADAMAEIAPTLELPTLVMHGGQDFATPAEDVVEFFDLIPDGHGKKRIYYPEGHHLLMYDAQRELVIDAASDWIDHLPERGNSSP